MTIVTVKKRYALHPIKTPGIAHVQPLSQESAETVSRILSLNTASNHIYTSSARQMGVCKRSRIELEERIWSSYVLISEDRHIFTITLLIIPWLCSR